MVNNYFFLMQNNFNAIFLEPENFDETVEKRDREYIRRLKTLYGKLT